MGTMLNQVERCDLCKFYTKHADHEQNRMGICLLNPPVPVYCGEVVGVEHYLPMVEDSRFCRHFWPAKGVNEAPPPESAAGGKA